MDPSADAEAFLLGLEQGGGTAANDTQAEATTQANQVEAEQTNGQLTDASANGNAAPSANGFTSSGRRNKWGQLMEVKEEPPKPKKRRSRWEEVPEENTDTTLAVVPKEITICGGIRVCSSPAGDLALNDVLAPCHQFLITSLLLSAIPPTYTFCVILKATCCLQVYLPSALTGGPQSSDPKVRELSHELNEVNRKILNNDLDIPPEGERSPSPEPIYDRNGRRRPAFTLARCEFSPSLLMKRSGHDCAEEAKAPQLHISMETNLASQERCCALVLRCMACALQASGSIPGRCG